MARKNEQYRKSSASEISSAILAIFRKSPKKPLNCKQIAIQLGINNKEGLALTEKHLATLEQKGDLQECQKGKFRLKNQMGTITGHIDMTPYGTAYVVSPQLEEDVFIASPNLNHALNNDLVKVSLFAPHGRRSRLEGEVVEILEEGRREFVGIIERNSKYAFVIVDKRYIPYDIFVANEDAMDAKNGQKVVVQIVEWPKKAKNPIGKVVKVLGDVGNNETEMHAILEEFDLPYHFTKELEDEANALPDEIPASEIKSRRDFRDVTTFTIDPADAKDFDDALSIEFLEDETYRIGVHIADVTYYVRPGSKLEEEAQKRATSVYLVDRVVPMLPEKLSNNVCSLRPNEDKLTFSAVFIMDKEANVLKEWFGRTIIRSNRRFSYEQAQQVIETHEGDLVQEITTMDALAKILRAKRYEQGAISFDRKEVKFKLDKNGRPTGVYFKESKDANKLIEEFMLLANRKVAEFVGKRSSAPTFVYRVHDKPDDMKLRDFSNFLKKFGYKINTSGGVSTSKSINKLLTDLKGKTECDIFAGLAVRSMAKAIYTTENIGHYGLAFDYYCHFTSPIRRYPDMMVHRLLDRYLKQKSSVSQEEFEEYCKHSSSREQLAANAERASIKYKQVEWMKDHVGEIFEGTITSITEWGFYVELDGNLCEGMVSLRDLSDDMYSFDERNYCLRGRYTGNEYTLGDRVTIKIARADLIKRQLDYILITDEADTEKE